MSHPTKLKPHPLRKPGQNNGVRLRREPPDDSRCRSYGFKTDADLARCRMQLNLARLRRRSAGGGDTGCNFIYDVPTAVVGRAS